jgi:hypothetical protein
MRAWQLEPTLITFMGKMPGMLAVVGGFFFVSVARNRDWVYASTRSAP